MRCQRTFKTVVGAASPVFRFISLTLDEDTDASDTTKFAVFICCIDSEFTITEELLSLVSVKGTTGMDLFDAVLKVMLYFNQDYKLLEGNTTDGAPLMMGQMTV